MANSLMRFTSGQPTPQSGATPYNNQMQMLQQIKQFKQTFSGNPKQAVMNMVQQGLRSNEQLQQAMNMAQQFRGLL
jgi:hypothetical protein